MNFENPEHMISHIPYGPWYVSYEMVHMIWSTWYDPYDMVHMIWHIWYGPYAMVHMIWSIWYDPYDMAHILWTIIENAFNIMIWYMSWNSPESYIQGKDKVWQPRYYEANHNEKDGLVYTITPLIWNCHDRGQCHHNFYVTKINYLHYIM